jgi:hypothetical protein
MNDDLHTWLSKRITFGYPPPPTHCLSERDGSKGRPDSIPRYPLFQGFSESEDPKLDLPHPKSAVIEKGDDRESDFSDENRGGPPPVNPYRRLRQITQETEKQFGKPLSDGSERERRHAYTELLRQEEAMRRRVENMAARIDERYKVEKPSKEGCTNQLEETRRLYFSLAELGEEHGGQEQLGKLISGQTNLEQWMMTERTRDITTMASGPPDDSAELHLRAFSPGERRPCVHLGKVGYKTGIESIPVDVKIIEAMYLVYEYYCGLKKDAFGMANGFSLLVYRLTALQIALTKYEAYGGYANSMAMSGKTEKYWYEKEIDDSNMSINLCKMLSCAENILSSYKHRNEVWKIKKGKARIHFTNLHRKMKRNKRNPLKKKNGGTMSRRQFSKKIKKHFPSSHIREMKKEAGVH